MSLRLRVSIVGPGRFGSALAHKLKIAGYEIREIVYRARLASRKNARALARGVGAKALALTEATLDADLIWLCVPDGQIAGVARELAKTAYWKRKFAFHSSGALTSDELAALRKEGAAVACIHPLMTFVGGTDPTLAGVPFAIEGDPAAVKLGRQIVLRLGGVPFSIRKQDKSSYHAFATFTSPLLIALLVAAEQVAAASGLSAKDARRKMVPILRQTVENYARLGPEKSFSGPLVRGDAETVEKHLRTLKRIVGTEDAYRSLALIATKHLPVANRRQLKRLLSST